MQIKNLIDVKKMEWFLNNCITYDPKTNKNMTYAEIGKKICDECRLSLPQLDVEKRIKEQMGCNDESIKCMIRSIRPIKDIAYLDTIIESLFSSGGLNVIDSARTPRSEIWTVFEPHFSQKTMESTHFKRLILKRLAERGIFDRVEVIYGRENDKVTRKENHYANIEITC